MIAWLKSLFTSKFAPKRIPILSKQGWSHIEAWIEGEDIIMKTIATAFGGSADKADNGYTASGYPTKGNDDLIACSLPMRRDNFKSGSRGYVLRNSPIPDVPFGFNANGPVAGGTVCDVTFRNGRVVRDVGVIDIGPGNWTMNGFDCSIGLARQYDKNATANNFEAPVEVRIKGAAKYILPYK